MTNEDTNISVNGVSYHDASGMFHFTSDVADVVSRLYRNYCIFIFCTNGKATFVSSGKELRIETLSCIVVLNNATFKWIETSPDFSMLSLFVSNEYISHSFPDNNNYTEWILSIMEQPILRLKKEEFDLCFSVGQAIRARLSQHDHMFYDGVLRRCVETLMLDIFNIRAHSEILSRGSGTQGRRIFRNFISMLEKGDYKREREVRWYASQLNITPKYLTEVCIDASGHSASHWINKFTTDEIARLLHNPTLSIDSIAELLSFNTRSYFSHYVRQHFGMTSRDYRQKILGGPINGNKQ